MRMRRPVGPEAGAVWPRAADAIRNRTPTVEKQQRRKEFMVTPNVPRAARPCHEGGESVHWFKEAILRRFLMHRLIVATALVLMMCGWAAAGQAWTEWHNALKPAKPGGSEITLVR